MPNQDFLLYQQSISDEFKALKNRVRNIIGDAHWGEEGRYKEIILMNMLRKVLPKQMSVGTGFVMNSEGKLSSQIDIIVYDNTFPILFSEGDFIVVSNQSVLGIVEVKTKLYLRQIEKVIDKASNNGELIGNHIFNGIFSYDNQFTLMQENSRSRVELERCLRVKAGYVNHLSLGENFFIRYWDRVDEKYYSMYQIERLSFSYFISNLIECSYLNTVDGQIGDRISHINSFLYSIEEGKEAHKFYDIYC